MKPGIELDDLVAEKVMGEPKINIEPTKFGEFSLEPGGLNYNGDKPITIDSSPYSTEISAAWEVVEKLRNDKWSVMIHTIVSNMWVAQLENNSGIPKLFYRILGNTAPHAICLAALKTLERSDN